MDSLIDIVKRTRIDFCSSPICVPPLFYQKETTQPVVGIRVNDFLFILFYV